MNITAPGTALLHPSAIEAGERAGLRLVASGMVAHCESPNLSELPATRCLALRSAIVDTDTVSFGVLSDLFTHLRQGERIEFVHRVRRVDSDNDLSARPYSLCVDVASEPALKTELGSKVSEAMIAAYPSLYFMPADEVVYSGSEMRTHDEVLQHVLQFAPAGLVAAAKPALARFERQAKRRIPLRSRFMREGHDAEQLIWPFPGMLANWPLTAPLYESMDLPELVEIRIRIHAFTLTAETCKAIHQTVMRVLAGNLTVFHPESPIATYSDSPDLHEKAIELMRHWLRHPAGYAVDCVIRSSAKLGDAARRRIAVDVFGKCPFEVVREFDVAAPLRLARPTLAWACSPVQGIPALMPGLKQLPTLAVPRHYPMPPVMPPQAGALLGKTVCGRRSVPVAIPYGSRSRHVALFGATGSGKSSLMMQMISQDIADPQRRCGVGLIDPHGDLYQRVLSIIPPERADDVVLVDTGDLFNTVCLNPLEGMRDDPLLAQFVVGEIMSLIENLFETKDSSGPLLRHNLRNLLLLSSSFPTRHGTFLDAVRILEDADFRDQVLATCNNRNVVDYWRQFIKTHSSINGFAEWLPYIMARLGPFTMNPIMKRLLCRPDSTIDFAQAMRGKKIVLFNLNKSVLQDVECQVLGSLILMNFFSAALSNGRLTAEERPAFHLYVDEFQTFATDSVPRLFAEGRKYNLCLTTANQSIGQLQNRWGRTNIAESILANTATKFLFRLGPSDVEILNPYFRPQFEASEMTNLPDFHAVACMADRNRPVPPFMLQSNLVATSHVGQVPTANLIARSNSQYAVPIDQANQELLTLHDLSLESLGQPKLTSPCTPHQSKTGSLKSTVEF